MNNNKNTTPKKQSILHKDEVSVTTANGTKVFIPMSSIDTLVTFPQGSGYITVGFSRYGVSPSAAKRINEFFLRNSTSSSTPGGRQK